MSQVSFNDLIGDIQQYAFSPLDIRNVIFNALEQATDGTLDVVDATNPFVYSISATAASVAAFMREHEVRTSRLYPAVATTLEDLYLHMSDKDYVDRFALPSTATIRVIFQKTPLLSVLVNDPITGNAVTIIPRNTLFKVAGITFSMQYPIEIRQLAHGGLQITYINDKPTPLKALASNVVNWTEYTDVSKNKWVAIDIDVEQFFVDTKYADISTSAGFVTDIPLTDQYYYTRCYLQNSAGAWTEIKTTYTDRVYDASTVTALIQVLEGSIKVTMPVVYTSTALASGKLRIDVYQTQGKLSLPLYNYTAGEYSANWNNIDSSDDTPYSIGVRQINNVLIMSTSKVDGGRDALSFSALKKRVIDNSVGDQILPITQTQLSSSMSDLGYDIIKHIDTLTDRVFLATRELPKPSDASILSPASSTLLTTTVLMSAANDTYGAYDNGDTVTLTQTTIYQCVNGVTRALTKNQVSDLLNMNVSQRCNVITDGGYYYSPFTYVLDATQTTFDVRAYALDTPVITSRNFIEENETTGLQVSVSDAYTIEKDGANYILKVKTASSSAYKALSDAQVYAQLSISSVNQATRVSVQGTLDSKDASTGERIFKFVLTTNFNIDANDTMEFPSISSTTNGLNVRLGMSQDIDIIFTTTSPMGSNYRIIGSDQYIDPTYYADESYPAVISHEKFGVKFGVALKSLWVQSRSAISDIPVKVYTSDVPAYYEADVFQTDTSGVHFTVDGDGRLVYNYLHRKGDPILDSTGSQVYKHRRGEMIVDVSGNPVYMDGYKRQMARYIDISMLPGVYSFSTDPVMMSYIADIKYQLAQWISADLAKYQDYLLELTRIYFHPRVNCGIVQVLDGDGNQTYINSEQKLTLKLYVTKKVYSDEVLKKKLSDISVVTINQMFQSLVVSTSDIISALRTTYASDVLDVNLTGLGGGSINGNIITILDKSARLSLGRRLVVREDNVLTVQENVDIQFIQHSDI